MKTWNQKFKEIPITRELPFPKLKLTSVRNTVVKCTQCFGHKINIVKRSNGSRFVKYCAACMGTGETFIKEDGLSQLVK